MGVGIGLAIAGGLAATGAVASGIGTAEAQNAQNKAAAQAAAGQSAQAFTSYLASRGVSLQQLVANDPRGAGFWTGEYNKAKASGNKDDFDTWLYKAIKASPADPIWGLIANPAGSAGAANTTLPAWAVGADGKPIQPALYQQLIDTYGSTGNAIAKAPIGQLATLENVNALFAANPTIKQGIVDNMAGSDDTRTPEQWLVDHITQTESASGGGAYTTLLRNFATAKAAGGDLKVVGDDGITPVATTAPASASPGTPGVGNNTTLNPALSPLIDQSTAAANDIFNGTYLKQVQDALDPIAAARQKAADAALARVTEQRDLSGALKDTELSGITDVLNARTAGAGNIYSAAINSATGVRDAGTTAANGVYDADVQNLAKVLGVRLDEAQQIYDATSGAAGGVRDARTTGAKDIYGAELTRADTYGQAAQDALSRILAEQGAERARRGFTGGSSGSDITRARLLADYTQRGAGARADAGVNYQGRLSDAGIGYATDIGNAGIGRATTIGQSREQDAIAQLNAAVQKAKDLGLVGTNFATQTGAAGVTQASTLASAGEQNAIAQLQAKADDARRRLTYLTSDADIAAANADLQNAQDQLSAITADQQRKTSAITLPYQLANLDLATKGSLTGAQYTDIDELMKRLQGFTLTPATGAPLTTSTPGSVLNGLQIGGSALTAGANTFASLYGRGGLGGSGTGGTTNTGTGGYSLLQPQPTFLGGSSVFKGPTG